MQSLNRQNLFTLIAVLRQFFIELGFTETPTPPIVTNPGMETHLHPFQIYSAHKKELLPLFLHTSPEFYMKELLSDGYQKIYNLSYCFRDEPKSETHRKQFLMLEWYRANAHYSQIKVDIEKLIDYCSEQLSVTKLQKESTTVDDLFKKYLNFSILDFLNEKDLKEKILSDHPTLLDKNDRTVWPWEDYFFLLYLNLIEPHFKKYPYLLVDKFPSPLAALSTIDQSNPQVCNRFELYMNGIEVANCFDELVNLDEQKQRMELEAKKKKDLYQYELSVPQVLYNALDRGIPPSAGIALGVERLLMGLKGTSQSCFFN